MRNSLLVLASLFMFTLGATGCGDEVMEVSGSAPKASGLQASPTTITVGQQASIQGTLDFEDPDGDLAVLTGEFTVNGESQSVPAQNVQDVQGKTSGTLDFTLALVSLETGPATLTLYLVDQWGHESNEVSLDFVVE